MKNENSINDTNKNESINNENSQIFVTDHKKLQKVKKANDEIFYDIIKLQNIKNNNLNKLNHSNSTKNIIDNN